MLMTVKLESERQKRNMERPDRISKVRASMAAIKTVIGERERALQEASEKVRDTNALPFYSVL